MKTKYDLAIIGGGPAGMMAALIAAQNNQKVVLLEKNQRLGRKLLLTGKGRCNITHDEADPKKLIEKYNKEGKFLMSGFSQFGVKETIDFFIKNGLKLKVERGSRYFPELNDANYVVKFFEDNFRKYNIEVKVNAKVIKIAKQKDKITKLILKTEEEIIAKNYLVSTGGCSYPSTGSDGEVLELIKKLGHNIIDLSPALVPLKVKESWVKELSGLSLKNVELQIKKTKTKIFGEMLFTHFGISGPIVLNISHEAVRLLKKEKEIELLIDLKPALKNETLDKRLQNDFGKHSNKLFKNSLYDLLPIKLADKIVLLAKINPNKKVNVITKEERLKILSLIKQLPLTVVDHLGFETAIVTSGGVDLKEVDQKTMNSKLIKNLYFAGEVLNIDGKTGGYNLQMCWTTGYVAGKNSKP